VTPPGESTQLGEDDPWLYNAGLAWHVNEKLAWYAGYSRGLEEGGVAPENAANKDAAPPAIRTKQWDAGLRYAFTDQLKLVAGVFDIEKPYYSLDSANIYRSLGEQRHKGVEFSIAGQALEGFNIVVGAMFLNPQVTGEEVDSGAIGEVPVGQINRLIIAGADYRFPRLPGLSIDATLTHVGDRMVTTDNQLEIPSRSVLDMGARWRFKIGRAPATLRFFLGNVTDKFGWRTNTSSVLVTNAPRRLSISIAADFGGE
jgi:iron complex outermembrane receptor protein